MIKDYYLGFKLSFSYFSILPMRFKESDRLDSPKVYGAMLFFFPLVGLVLGFMTIGIFLVLENLSWYGAILSALIYLMLYGFLHLEAVSDVFDALYASHAGKDAYAIIKEPTIGAMGMLYTLGFVVLKLSGIVYLLLHGLFVEFIAILIISRLSLLLLFYVHNFRSSFATTLKSALNKYILLLALSFYSLIAMNMSEYFFVLLLFGVIFAIMLSYWLKYKLGFINGDVMGTTLESVEIILFIIISYIISI
ncbi:Cobalamin synthase [hydrothermal vent metagenome]|uniref:Adenosylcobinamide-GDP ribazoletransferase n=1 Tax=hydrothermal vent metagenome TaxID=652676 RepID=A0A1W1CPH2_9ZZZZ